MGRKKRPPRNTVEEEEFQRAKREKNAARQRAFRERKNQASTSNRVVLNLENPMPLLNFRILNVITEDNDNVSTDSQFPVQNPDIIIEQHTHNQIPDPSRITAQIPKVAEDYIGNMNVQCKHCSAKHFAAERVANKKDSFNDCCSHGKVFLPPLPDPPQIICSLLDGNHAQSVHFRERIRSYNNSFAFASFNANLVDFNNRRPGPYCFKIHGQIYYQINTSLYPTTDENPSFGQLFIVDQTEATDFRCQRNSHLNADILREIDSVIRTCNPFALSYQTMNEELQQLMRDTNTQTEPELSLLFSLKPGMDYGRYNLQRIHEVAAIFSTTADGEIPESYVTIRDKQTKSLQYVNSMDPNVEPWIYPLLYPYGTQGWHSNLRQTTGDRRITRNDYLQYRIAIRDDNYFLKGGRLFQQWIVDNYVKMEKDRITYDQLHQKQLRAESYQGLIDHLNNRTVNENARLGKMIILPSSFVGSPRYMLQNYQDSMAIVRKYGKPDLFITMTSNPHWREIEENLLPGQTASDRPDIVSRVFDLKKKQLLNYIIHGNLFGEVLAYVYVVEYQKRGLPHVHSLITLKQNHKISTPDEVDKYISAEIPNKDEHPELHNIVIKNMIHTCGNWCLDDKGKCSKKFPKEFRNETTMDENGYPYYRRLNTGQHKRNNQDVDNRNVVPYNPTLLLRMNCHINVEVTSSLRAVKYLYKYVNKGHDSARVSVVNNSTSTSVIDHDEIRNYLETRYVGPVEAATRIFNKKIQDKSHSITRLPVHLENQQNVTIHDDGDDDMIRAALRKRTMLAAYFELNECDLNARQFTYSEIPTHYTFKKNADNSYSWNFRKAQFNVIGRMYSVSPSQTELFHLRLLLITVKGATSFQHLRTVNGIIHDTYQETCLALGLIEDDSEWMRAMEEAEVWMMPRQLRNLFVRILIHCQPNHPKELWESFKEAMSQDFALRHEPEIAVRNAYSAINAMLTNEGSSLAHFPAMDQISEIGIDEDDISIESHRDVAITQYEKLNEEQKIIVDKILLSVTTNDASETCFFIDGPGGSGKTFIYTTLYHLLRSHQKNVSTMAFTGIAAILLPQGKTVHKTFGMPVPLFKDSTSNIKNHSELANYLKNCDIFIWDEAPMAPKYALQLVDRTLRDFMNDDRPFGGKTMVLGGDFRQLLPVKKHATRSEMVSLSIKFSYLWRYFSRFSLTRNMRTLPEEHEFAQFLISIGDGTENDCNDNVQLPEGCIADPGEDIVKSIYGDLIDNHQYSDLSKVAILSARNADVDEINNRVVELLDKTTERIYTSIDSLDNCNNGDISEAILPEYLNTLNPVNIPPHELRLRVNCIVMLIRNLSINEGLCNGTRLQIVQLANNLLQCRILTGDKAGEIVFINRITLYCEDEYPFSFKRRQFPIKLAFAMTINKSQGQTFEKIGIDLRRDVFNHGQLYVALSRVRSLKSVRIFFGEQRTHRSVKNYVFKELFV